MDSTFVKRKINGDTIGYDEFKAYLLTSHNPAWDIKFYINNLAPFNVVQAKWLIEQVRCDKDEVIPLIMDNCVNRKCLAIALLR